jgi:hypothetical protein
VEEGPALPLGGLPTSRICPVRHPVRGRLGPAGAVATPLLPRLGLIPAQQDTVFRTCYLDIVRIQVRLVDPKQGADLVRAALGASCGRMIGIATISTSAKTESSDRGPLLAPGCRTWPPRGLQISGVGIDDAVSA